MVKLSSVMTLAQALCLAADQKAEWKDDPDKQEIIKKEFKEIFDRHKEDCLDLLYWNDTEIIQNLYNSIFCLSRFYSGDKDLYKTEVVNVKK